jgi:phosphate-starvation-inducible protein E
MSTIDTFNLGSSLGEKSGLRALIAVSRKFVILDTATTEATKIAALAAAFLALVRGVLGATRARRVAARIDLRGTPHSQQKKGRPP